VPDEVIYSLAYNTYTHGHNPIGSNGPYSSLNVALNSTSPTIGTDVEFGAFFQDSTWAGAYCTGNQSPLDVFRWDGPCWNYTPVAQFNLVPSTVTLSVSDDLICDAEEAYVDFSDVPDLYGYEFKVEYDAAKVDATGSFLNDWFDTTGQFIVWDADCDAGVCKFSVSKNGTTATPISGDGRVAKIALDPTGGGNFDLKIKDVTLTNIDGFAIPSTLVDDTIEVGACGTAKVSGKVSLQGRVTPMNSGWVTFINTDSSGFADLTVNFDANGNYSAEVPVMPTGSAYKVRAFHYLYLANEKAAQTLTPGQTLNNQNTRLLGGDANNSGVYTPFTPGVEALDIGCIGGDFGGSSDSCGADPNSSTDINNDGHVNIQDLSIAGGNFDKNPFQNW